MKFSVYFGSRIYSKGHEYAPWQYERMPHKLMVNRLISKGKVVCIDQITIAIICFQFGFL